MYATSDFDKALFVQKDWQSYFLAAWLAVGYVRLADHYRRTNGTYSQTSLGISLRQRVVLAAEPSRGHRQVSLCQYETRVQRHRTSSAAVSPQEASTVLVLIKSFVVIIGLITPAFLSVSVVSVLCVELISVLPSDFASPRGTFLTFATACCAGSLWSRYYATFASETTEARIS